jgi:demethylmenaquinone methyltransferase/2-methoxy-6-polyprenyl-1,4-benzoquinol methylase
VTNKYYSEEQRAAKVNDLFAAVASRYDLLNDLQSFGLHRWWKHRVLQLAQARAGETAIDLCCGTGDIAFGLARSGATVVGLDFNSPMLVVAEGRKQKPAPHFLRGDAQRIPFPDNSFDVVTMGYGLRNLASWETGLREMQRVARPGGRLLILEFGKPDNALWRSIYFAYMRRFVPLLGRIFCNDAAAYAYILESLEHYPAQHGVAQKMRELGLEKVEIVSLLGGVMSINCAEKAGRQKMENGGRIN